MFITWGPVADTGRWRAEAGNVVRESGDAAACYQDALRLAGHRQDRLRRIRFAAPPAPPAPPVPKAKAKAKAPKRKKKTPAPKE